MKLGVTIRMVVKLKFFLMVIFFNYGCESNERLLNGNYLGVSRSLDESKDNGFFVKKLYSHPEVIIVDSLVKFQIRDVFVEKKWRSNNDYLKTSLENWQLIILTSDEISSEYGFDCKMVSNSGHVFWQLEKNAFVTTLNDLNITTKKIKITTYIGDVFYLDTVKKEYHTGIFSLSEKK
jgi:hypothetical protein